MCPKQQEKIIIFEKPGRQYESLRSRFRFEPFAVEIVGLYGGSTTALISEIGRRTSGESGKSRETFWREQRSSLAVQRGNALSILTAVREKTMSNLRQADRLLNESRKGCKPPSFTFGQSRDPCSESQYVFQLLINKDVRILGRL